MKRARTLGLLVAALAMASAASAQSDYDRRSTIGPDKGWLVVHGGGPVTNEVKERFVALAGGPNATFVAIPTALTDQDIDVDKYGADISRALGVAHLTVLHTRDRARANSDAFVEPLRHAWGVWIDGGRQWRLTDAYLGTAVERELKSLLARGGVIAGSSAGATIQGSYLVRGAPGTVQNPDGDNTILMSPGHETGFALLANSAIDQHVNARSREADLERVIAAHPNLLGIGIDEATAIVVHGNAFFVVGGQVAIYDGKDHDGAHHYFLSPGQAFDLKARALDASDEGVNAEQYSLVFKAMSASRSSGPDGILTVGTGQLDPKGGSPQGEETVKYSCNVSLYSLGGTPYPAHRDGPDQMTIRTRAVDGDTLRDYPCRMDTQVQVSFEERVEREDC
jgi:cyanophycinase